MPLNSRPHPYAPRVGLPLLALLFAALLPSASAKAQAQCASGQGASCRSSADCASNTSAKVCVEGRTGGTCQIPCDNEGLVDPSQCSMGETCVLGTTPGLGGGDIYYCQVSKFSMDLNLLDACIYHFLEGLAPDLSGGDQCSLVQNLSRMLDQDASGSFNIYDVDLCVRAFLKEPPCDAKTQTCDDGQVFCTADTQCGRGLHCDTELNKCVRECGYIVNRGGGTFGESLDRECSGRMKTCDYDTGRCVASNLEGYTCQVDQDCPSGAYCFLGQCAPKCYRSLDCPGSDWYCGPTNACLPRPKSAGGDIKAFDPTKYSVQFATPEVTLDPLNDSYELPLLIMDLISKKQVSDNPNVVFGYRLEVEYAVKQDDKCRTDLTKLPVADAKDCLVAPEDGEAFITLASPFGSIYGSADPSLGISLNEAAVQKLSTGLYQATVSAIFNNGTRTSVTVRFKKPAPSGEYLGRVSVYSDGPQNLLASSNMSARIYIDRTRVVTWDQLLGENNLGKDREWQDVTEGHPITGTIHGNESAIFNWPGATTQQANEIPVKGLYSDDLGRMRLIAVIDYPANFCRSENGSCGVEPNELRVTNNFGRPLRRFMEFLGPFNPETFRFEGIYRETLTGLTPSAFTLDGGFILTQVKQDETPLPLGPLLAKEGSVGFPSHADVVKSIDDAIRTQCGADEKALVASRAAFGDYLAGVDVQRYCSADKECDPGQVCVTGQCRKACSAASECERGMQCGVFPGVGSEPNRSACRGKAPALAQLVQFEQLVGGALATLKGNAQASLTIRDFLRGQISFCDEKKPAQNCVDRTKVTCGINLYRKALLESTADSKGLGSSWLDLTNVHRRDVTLFCSQVPGSTADCPFGPRAEPALWALQEHNRFFKELVQTHAYRAGDAASQAFMTLFHAANGQPIDESSAYEHKGLYLQTALGHYDAIRDAVFSPASTELLFAWPMAYFSTRGDVWLKQVHTTINDRMATMLELVDHRRRVLKSASQQHLLFAHHVMHQEYLQQVYLMALQREWQGESFKYAGQAQELMLEGDKLLAKANDTRNPLGLHPNRIYFENSDLTRSNWQNFRERLRDELPLMEQDIQGAIQEMKGSLSDQDTFKRSLLLDEADIETTIDELCGSEEPLPQKCSVSVAEKKLESQCTGPDCAFTFTCDGPECSSVIRAFDNGSKSAEVACRADTRTYSINVLGKERPCARGRLGALLQEKVFLELQRGQVVKRVQALVRQIARQQQFMHTTEQRNTDLTNYLETQSNQLSGMEAGLVAADLAYDMARAVANGLDCWLIAGLAVGTNCPQKIAQTAMLTTALGVLRGVKEGIGLAQSRMLRAKEIELSKDSQSRELLGLRMTLDNMVTEVENHIAEYESVTQQLFNLQIQIDDVHYQAQRMADRHAEKVGFLVDHLVGRESGSILVRNRLVKSANERFQRMLIEAYKMTRAFIHRYNVDNQAEAWSNRVYQIVTVNDMKQFLAFLDGVELNYCGAQGLDCDYVNNGEVFEFSMQKQLFPGLRDIVDPATGKVLTVGQQFHNLITGSGYVKTRARPYGISQQIELPFAIWLNDRGEASAAPQRYMVGPGDCNHIIRGAPGKGTIAVNIVGTRLPRSPGIKFELWRGNTDYIRSCTEKVSTYESKVSTYIVGWTPNNLLGQLDSPPSFLSQSGELPACINNHLLRDPASVDSQEGCFQYFARDRSLGAPDWRLVIPYLHQGQSWLLGDGRAADEKPIIEDIVLYFRYNDRPITMN